ncbi:MAG: YoaK family protein [Phycisphaerales bacterium]
MNPSPVTATPAANPPKVKPPATWLAPLLAGVAGFVDTAGFVVFAGVFLAHVTGNFVVLGATLPGQGLGSAAMKLAVLPLFIIGVAIGWLIVRRSPRKSSRHIATVEGLLLLAGGGLGVWSHYPGSMPHMAEPVAMACGVLAMALQSMLARSLKLPMTHVMTGNVTQLTVDLLDARFGHPECGAAASRNIALVAAFACGAVLSGVLVSSFGLAVLVIPAVVLLAIARTIESR